MNTFNQTEFFEIGRKYEVAFPGFYVPQPFLVSPQTILEEMKKALKENKPISYEFDWRKDLPDDADA